MLTVDDAGVIASILEALAVFCESSELVINTSVEYFTADPRRLWVFPPWLVAIAAASLQAKTQNKPFCVLLLYQLANVLQIAFNAYLGYYEVILFPLGFAVIASFGMWNFRHSAREEIFGLSKAPDLAGTEIQS